MSSPGGSSGRARRIRQPLTKEMYDAIASSVLKNNGKLRPFMFSSREHETGITRCTYVDVFSAITNVAITHFVLDGGTVVSKTRVVEWAVEHFKRTTKSKPDEGKEGSTKASFTQTLQHHTVPIACQTILTCTETNVLTSSSMEKLDPAINLTLDLVSGSPATSDSDAVAAQNLDLVAVSPATSTSDVVAAQNVGNTLGPTAGIRIKLNKKRIDEMIKTLNDQLVLHPVKEDSFGIEDEGRNVDGEEGLEQDQNEDLRGAGWNPIVSKLSLADSQSNFLARAETKETQTLAWFGVDENSQTEEEELSGLNALEWAKNWKPKDKKARKELEIAQELIYEALVCLDGVKIHEFDVWFERIHQRRLDYGKIGANLRTILFTMKDKIRLKRHSLSGHFFVFASLLCKTCSEIQEIIERNCRHLCGEFSILPSVGDLTVVDVRSLFMLSDDYFISNESPTLPSTGR